MFKKPITGYVSIKIINFFQPVQIHEEENIRLSAVHFFCGMKDAGMIEKAGKGIVIGHTESCLLFMVFSGLGQKL